MWGVVPRTGIKPRPSILGMQSLSPWITREVPPYCFLYSLIWMDNQPDGTSAGLWVDLSSSRSVVLTLGSVDIWGTDQSAVGISPLHCGCLATSLTSAH